MTESGNVAVKPVGKIQHFKSKVDGNFYPYAVCATDTDDNPKPLIVEISPGAWGNLSAAVTRTETIINMSQEQGFACVALRPTGRGNGSVYQNYGEIDVLEAIEHISSIYAIDRDRITVTGASMGGAATWYLISHYPDLFAGAVPFCGYCDYQLWEKPGGLTFHMHQWEEASWKSRSAAFIVENLRHTPVWIVHGEWDRAVGGGVPVEHSREMAKKLDTLGYTYEYTEVPEIGHGCQTPEILRQITAWLLAQKKERYPEQISLATYSLRHNRSYWTAIDQLEVYGQRGLVEAELTGSVLRVQTENIQTLSIGPVDDHPPVELLFDDQVIGSIDLKKQRQFQRNQQGIWEIGPFNLFGQKRPQNAGPISDLFYDELLLVPGTIGTEEERFFNTWVADNAATYFRTRNGGVHRGGIMGDNEVELVTVLDTELNDIQLQEKNLLLYGTYTSNAVMAALEGEFPLTFSDQVIQLAGKSYIGDRVAVLAVFPHPDHPHRYVAIHGGVSPDSVTWGSHLDMQLLPDYIVYCGGETLDWGFWSNEWSF
ncbi:TPA: hypothetical protein DHW51_20775 [Candidatus Poribacteria bacterium]|nr:hypothetical protein [Candidatus Poribacteria bacterium]